MIYKRKPKKDIYSWHIWFAWYPVITSTHVFWLEKVLRRCNIDFEYITWEFKRLNEDNYN